MSRSPDQSRRWPSERKALALRADDFDGRRTTRNAADLKRRMNAWARGVVARLAELGVDAEARAVDVGDSAQVQFTTRSTRAMERATDGQGATRLLLAIDGIRVRAGLEVPATRAQAAQIRLSDPARALELATALEALPEQFAMGASSGDATVEAPRATADDLRALLGRIEPRALRDAIEPSGPRTLRDAIEPSDPRERSDYLWIGWTVPRALALEHAALLDEQLEDAIAALAQLFALLGATMGGDEDGASKGRRFSGRRAHPKGTRRDDEGDRDRGRDAEVRARGRGRERDRDPDAEGDAEPEPTRDAIPPGTRRLEAKIPPRSPSGPTRRRPLKASQVAIEKGGRVSVLKGPFSGKVGVVHELDGKGGARVMLGLLAVRLEVKNLMPCVEGRGRPVLSSSHRKPIPARS